MRRDQPATRTFIYMDTAWASKGQVRNRPMTMAGDTWEQPPPKFLVHITRDRRAHFHCPETPLTAPCLHLLEVFSCVHFCESFKPPWGRDRHLVSVPVLPLECPMWQGTGRGEGLAAWKHFLQKEGEPAAGEPLVLLCEITVTP